MFNMYEVLFINDSALNYKVKYKYLVMKFCGADAQQRPIYNLVKKCRTQKSAEEWISKQNR